MKYGFTDSEVCNGLQLSEFVRSEVLISGHQLGRAG